ncbi:receptor-like cytoplasmic kinase 185 [Papaver somniferum]|uniref:receptor-like cytoplasmic kinase 185 n=1 Tax=Papaver somniferum TaxID=3469 RepID=UPI000E6FE749|nr:receptor-like cytoplasmic kinase 185 [Papaver somniferum]
MRAYIQRLLKEQWPDKLVSTSHNKIFSASVNNLVVAVRQVNEKSVSNIYRGQSLSSTINLRSLLYHPNIVDMIGYCIDGDQIFFVYNFLPSGSLKDHLHDLPPNKKPLDWNTRIKIAAKGIKYLHEKSKPPVIHGNIKPSNILLCKGYHPKLSDFLGFKERIPESDKSNHARIFSSQCYRHAPEFYMKFKLTQRSDIYSFGLVLLELISGRMAEIRPSLIEWLIELLVCLVIVRAKRKLVGGHEFTALADPLLKGRYPEQGLYQALSLAAECLQSKDASRPRIGDVVNVLSNLASQIYDPKTIQINRAGTLTIGNLDKERLTELWQHVWSFPT